MYFGKGSAGLEQRRQEIEKIAKVFKKRAKKERANVRKKNLDDTALETYFVLGDLNILAPDKTTGESDLRDTHDKKRTFVDNVKVQRGDPRSKPQIQEWYATTWRTYHMSDHLPMWMALNVDFAEDYLNKCAEEINE